MIFLQFNVSLRSIIQSYIHFEFTFVYGVNIRLGFICFCNGMTSCSNTIELFSCLCEKLNAPFLWICVWTLFCLIQLHAYPFTWFYTVLITVFMIDLKPQCDSSSFILLYQKCIVIPQPFFIYFRVSLFLKKSCSNLDCYCIRSFQSSRL